MAMLRGALCVLALATASEPDAFPDDKYAGTPKGPAPARILVVYAADAYNQIERLAEAVGEGATSTGAEVQVLEVSSANYNRHVSGWADGIVLGSGVFNGNAAPRLLEFINSFDFMDDLSGKVGASFATGGAAAAGLEPVLSSLNRGLKMFGVVTVGGTSWRNSGGTAALTSGDNTLDDPKHALASARDEGARVAHLAKVLKRGGVGAVEAPLPGVNRVLDSITVSLGRAKWTEETVLHTTCEAYCRGWTAAIGCGTCSPAAFSFPGADHMCIHPGPTGTGLLCRMDQVTGEVTGESCCGVGGPCQLPEPSPSDANDTSSLWPGGCCHGGSCATCAPAAAVHPGGSPVSDVFPQLDDSRTFPSNRRYFDYEANACMLGVKPVINVVV